MANDPQGGEGFVYRNTDTQRFIYGYGQMKHIAAEVKFLGYETGLCGANGGYPQEQPQRPICKRCLQKIKQPVPTQIGKP